MTRGGGGVHTPPKKDDIICEQPLIQGEGKDTHISVKKLILKRSRKISFKLTGQQAINVDLQLKKETGFRTKSRFEYNFRIQTYIFCMTITLNK